MSKLEKQLLGYRLTTAEIIYRMPDHLHLLQSFVWQDLDLAPEFPVLNKFLRFWEKNLDGPIHTVHVASAQLIKPAELRMVGSSYQLH
jgi:uncharacterized protein Usg